MRRGTRGQACRVRLSVRVVNHLNLKSIFKSHSIPSIVRLGNCCLAFQKFFFLCFCCGKSSKTSGGRELALALPLFCPAVSSARATPLPGCRARSGERIALRTTELLKALVSTRLLHAASLLAQTGAAPGKTWSPAVFQFTNSGRCPMQKPNRTLLPWPLFGKGGKPPPPLKKGDRGGFKNTL